MSNWCCVETESGGTAIVWWPMCAVNGCPNRICHSKSDKYCYPHSTNGKTHEQLMDELKCDETLPERVKS